jgi:hypothetical protein
MRAANTQFKLPSRKEFDASLARDAKAAKKKESAAASP